MPRGRGYDTVEDAAAAGLRAIDRKPKVEDMEFLSFVVRDPDTGLYNYTPLRTSGIKGAIMAGDVQDLLDRFGPDIAGIIHQHPSFGPRAINFSDTDAAQASKMGVPSFIGALQRNGVTEDRMLPLTGRQPQVPMERGRFSVPGQEFLAKFPIEELMQHIARRNPLAAAEATPPFIGPPVPSSLPLPKRPVPPIALESVR